MTPQSTDRHKAPLPIPFLVVVGAVFLIGLSNGLSEALIMAGLLALVWAVVAMAKKRKLFVGRPIPNGAVATLAALVLVVGASTASVDDTTAPPIAKDAISPAPALDADAGTESVAQPIATDPEPESEPQSEPESVDSLDSVMDRENDDDVTFEETEEPEEPAVPTEVLTVLTQLQIKGRAPKTGYDRDAFAYRSYDFDGNGCDSRNDVLRRDLRNITVERGTNDCVVLKGVLDDPYSGMKIKFTRGTATSNAVQIDHVVALSDAWQKGAQSWDLEKKKRFGNDPLNLIAVDGPLNAQKGDGDAATWLPPNKNYRCSYVTRQIAVKAAYGLWVTKSERDAMENVLSTCANQRLPHDVTTPITTKVKYGSDPNKSKPRKEKVPTTSTPEKPSSSVYYKNCTAARLAGAAPVYREDPGYGKHLDRDGDGIGCE